MWSFFKSKKQDVPQLTLEDFSFLSCDMHSHMIAGIDDGAPTLEDSYKLIKGLYEVGFRKMITTPHVHGDFYRNSKETILSNFQLLQNKLHQEGLNMKMEVAAEYYMDAYFLENVLPHGLLTFGNNYALVEISMMGWPRNFDEVLFETQSKGYNLIMAHPERYLYEQDVKVFEKLKEKGVLMQVNLLSFLGYYGQGIAEMASKLLEAKIVDFIGTDMHHERHLRNIYKFIQLQPKVAHDLLSYQGFKNRELL